MKRTLLRLAVALNRIIPEGRLKNEFRAWVCRMRAGTIFEVLVKRGDCVVQVGTPYPKTVDKLLRLAGPTGRLLVVEAAPQNIDLLSSHLKQIGSHNVSLIHKGAWSERGTMELLRATDSLDHRLEDNQILHDNDLVTDVYAGTDHIDVDTIDNIMKENGVDMIDFISITVNGAELQVLRGMEHMCQHTKRLFVKAHAIDKKTNRPLNQSIARFLQQRGFHAVITKSSPSRHEDFGERSGDVYAWR